MGKGRGGSSAAAPLRRAERAGGASWNAGHLPCLCVCGCGIWFGLGARRRLKGTTSSHARQKQGAVANGDNGKIS